MKKLTALTTLALLFKFGSPFAAHAEVIHNHVPMSHQHGHQNVLKSDEYYMQLAFNLARKNPRQPFATIIVDNQTEKS